MGEDMLTEKVVLADAAQALTMARLVRQNRELSEFLTTARTLELSMTARLLQARKRAEERHDYRREGMTRACLQIRPGTHPITPVMLGDARLAVEMARRLLDHGIYVIGFSYPVVPKGAARIRVQLSAAHSTEDVDRAITAFAAVGKDLGVVR